jgi:DASH complex subunit DAM1
MEALKAKAAAQRDAEAVADRTTMTEVTDAEMTYIANGTTSTSVHAVKPGTGPKKKSGKAKLTAKEKRERSVCVLFLFRCPTQTITYYLAFH